MTEELTEKVNLRTKVFAWTVSLITLVGLPTFEGVILNNHYNSLPRQEKIEYLKNQLKTHEHPPYGIMNPRNGGGILLTWSSMRQNTIRELERLRSDTTK